MFCVIMYNDFTRKQTVVSKKRYPMTGNRKDDMSISIKELAKLAGVSHTLVSGVLSNNPKCRISQKTRNKILKLSCEYDCRPNRIARKLRGGDMKTIFILTRVHPAPGHSLLIKEATNLLEQKGYQVFLAQTQSAEQTARQISEFSDFGCDGVLSCYTHYTPSPDVKISQVIISDYSEVPHDIGIDREYGAQILTHHLIEHGHSRIGFIGVGNWGVKEMQNGYRNAMKGHGLSSRSSWEVDLLYKKDGLKGILELIHREKVTAFVCANDFIAGRLMAVLAHKGIRVPEEIALTGADAMSFSEFTISPLTTAIYLYRTAGTAAAELLLSRISGQPEEQPLPISIKPQMHFGCSCGCKVHQLDQMFGTVPVFSLDEQIEMENQWRA